MSADGMARFASPPSREGPGEGAPPSRRRTPPPSLPLKGEGLFGAKRLRLAGYAALFGIPDAARDTILPGAFSASLVAREAPLPLLWQHRPTQRIGWIESAHEDDRGLRVIATLDPGTRGRELLAAGAVDGLSFGYRARRFRMTPQGRELAEVDVFEISLVTHPLQHGARVHWMEQHYRSPPPRGAGLGGGVSR